MVNLGRVGELDGFWLLGVAEDVPESGRRLRRRTSLEVDAELADHSAVWWREEQKTQKRATREAPHFEDPLFGDQWHLVNVGKFGADLAGNDINVMPVWAAGVNGTGVTVSVVDDGVDFRHPDIAPNWSPESSWDFTRKNNEPLPGSNEDTHGTRCAGQIAAVPNNVCGVGVAFGAKVAGERVIANATTDALEATAFNYKFQINDIFSSSWGPEDNGATVDGPGFLTQQALINGVTKGRKGLGSIFVFASGNGGQLQDNCNFDGYANSPYTISIGAITPSGTMPPYGEICAAHLAVTYSGDSRSMITTTDLNGSCTNKHSGTSAAAPMAAGIIALLLSARPDLGWRDVQYLMVQTAKVTDSKDADWSLNGAGYHVNHKYGFGNLDASALVNASAAHKLVPSPALTASLQVYAGLSIPVKSYDDYLEHTLEVASGDVGQLLTLEYVLATVRIAHNERRFLTIRLISPAGTVSMLATERTNDVSTDGFMPWTFSTVRCWGESPLGTWKLQVADSRWSLPQGPIPPTPGTLLSWGLTFHGICGEADTVLDSNGRPTCTESQSIVSGHRLHLALAVFAATAFMMSVGIVWIVFKYRERKRTIQYLLVPSISPITPDSDLESNTTPSTGSSGSQPSAVRPAPSFLFRTYEPPPSPTKLTPYDKKSPVEPASPAMGATRADSSGMIRLAADIGRSILHKMEGNGGMRTNWSGEYLQVRGTKAEDDAKSPTFLPPSEFRAMPSAREFTSVAQTGQGLRISLDIRRDKESGPRSPGASAPPDRNASPPRRAEPAKPKQ
ncbi:peptidase S8/S53 domain-containing protein [Hyaloraphidium curvatum]|nr:peptidase S8/S53 domain-containing protein [Hyaloraphidium curvatum]